MDDFFPVMPYFSFCSTFSLTSLFLCLSLYFMTTDASLSLSIEETNAGIFNV